MLGIFLNKKNSILINRTLIKLISCLLINIIMLSNIALACESSYSAVNYENQNLSPKISIDNNALNNMFINGLPESSLQSSKEVDHGLLDELAKYESEKKQKDKDKARLRRNPILDARSDEFDLRMKDIQEEFIVKQKMLWFLSRFKLKIWINRQLKSKDKIIADKQKFREFKDISAKKLKEIQQIKSFSAQLNSELLVSPSKKRGSRKNKNKKKKKSKKVKAVGKDHPIPVPEIKKEIELEKEASDKQSDDISEQETIVLKPKGVNPVTSGTSLVGLDDMPSSRRPVLEIGIRKLKDLYDLEAENFPDEINEYFSQKIEKMEQEILTVKKGDYRDIRDEIKSLESELLAAIEENKRAIAAAIEAKLKAQAAEKQLSNNGNARKLVNIKKTARPLDPFEKAVSLADPEKIPIRSVDDVTNELQGQILLLEQIIDAEMHSSMELPVFNSRREIEGLIIQVRFSEALEKIETGSDIIMELDGKFYDLKCERILNAGSKLLLKPANKTGVFADDFPIDISKGKFVYMPNTHSEDMQKKTIRAIIKKVTTAKTTGLEVLDYFLRIKSAVKDITEIEQLQEVVPFTENLDKFQLAAVNMIIKTRFGLILGPFGTGKTSVLLAGAKNIILNKKKPVFIIAPQHKIADDITLKAGDSKTPVIRVGSNPSKINPEVWANYSKHSVTAQKEFMHRYKELNQNEGDNGCLFVGTDMGASLDALISQLRNPESAKFLEDLTVIVDEAALINYPELITALYILRPDALILVGDHVQFSPYKLASRFSTKIMELFQKNIPQKAICRYHISSFKELISMPFNRVSLLINYRNPCISVDFLQEFYKGVITLQSKSKQNKDKIEKDTFLIEDTSNWETQSFEKKYNYDNSYCNPTEAHWIVKRIKYYLANGNRADDIVIITYYNGQIKLINDFIENDFDISEQDRRILKKNIFTPISFQGGEDKIVLASLVKSQAVNTGINGTSNIRRTNPVYLSEPEFAKTEALLVLLSRHKGKVNVIGNSQTLDALTKDKYPRINHLYSYLFSYKDKINALLEIQNLELSKDEESLVLEQDFIGSAI